MRYEVEIDGHESRVELEQREGHCYASVDRRSYELEVVRPEEGVLLLRSGTRVFEARVWRTKPNSHEVKIRGRLFRVTVIDRKHRRFSADHSADGAQQLTAPMPGKVVRVLLQPGDTVNLGQGVVVVEAMKMQNEIKSPKAGRVTEIRVSEGAAVSANQVLAVVE